MSVHLSCLTNILFVALFEPRDVGHAIFDSSWINAIHEELENFERNQVWTLVEPVGTEEYTEEVTGHR
jgi:hypothetical protein